MDTSKQLKLDSAGGAVKKGLAAAVGSVLKALLAVWNMLLGVMRRTTTVSGSAVAAAEQPLASAQPQVRTPVGLKEGPRTFLVMIQGSVAEMQPDCFCILEFRLQSWGATVIQRFVQGQRQSSCLWGGFRDLFSASSSRVR